MRQLRCFVVALTLISLAGVSSSATDEEGQQVKAVLYKEIDAWFKGEPKEILSCYAPDFVGYHAKSASPEAWDVVVTNRDSMQYVGQSVELAAKFKAHSDWQRKREMLHVSVSNDRALALVRQEVTFPDSTTRETIQNTWEDVFMLAKTDGEWKITNAIWRTTDNQRVKRWLPD